MDGTDTECKFLFDTFCKEINEPAETAIIYLCNLEDTDIIEDLYNGIYDTIDVDDSSQFNDCYPFD